MGKNVRNDECGPYVMIKQEGRKKLWFKYFLNIKNIMKKI